MTPEDFLAITAPLPEAMLLVSAKGRLLAANPAAGKLMGTASREMSAKSVADMVEEPEERVAGFLRTCARSSALAPGSLTWRRPDGQSLACLCHGVMVRPCRAGSSCLVLLRCRPKSEGNKFTMLNRQLDDLQKAHHKLRERKNRLESEVRERTRELQRSNKELEQFAYIASHDLQEPLRKILTFGDRLKSKCGEAVGAQGLDYLERMQKAAARMQTLINDLLTYSRVTTKARPFVSVDLGKTVGEVLSDLETRIEQTDGRVEVGDLPTIDADPVQMRQLLQNLLGNALKFHKKDKPPCVKVSGAHFSAKAGNEGRGGRFYQFIVEDNGIGFDAKYGERIFAPFHRLHGRSEYEGTGIGLSVCKKIVERHGGKIEARSKPAQGTAFIVTLPERQGGGTDEQAGGFHDR